MRAGLLLFGLLAPAAAVAQDTAIVIHPESAGVHLVPPDLPKLVAEEAIRFYNAAATTHLVGRTRLPHGNEWRGNVAIRNGPALIGGRIQGSLLVINGDAILDPGAEVTGTVLVVGGTISGATGAAGGEVREYREPLSYRVMGDSLAYAPDLRRRLRYFSPQYAFGTADTRSALTLSTGGTFNRVEGLPIVFGPVFDWRLQGATRLRLDALGVFRTAGDLTHTRGDLGYLIRTELRTGESRPISVGFRAFDIVAPVEDWGLRSAEVGWAAFLIQRDFRDYYVSKGIAGGVTAHIEAPLTLSVELRRERETSVLAQDPWTVFRNDQAWRSNPPVDDGHYTTVAVGLALDTRNDADNPTSGWYLRGTLERSASRDVAPQAGVPASVRDPIPTDGSYRFLRAWLDFRRYTRVSPGGRLNMRLLAGGWAGGDALPLQRRLSVGGPDPLPGYAFRQGRCDADITDPAFAGSRVAACDRVLMVQAEYRGHISLHWTYNPSRDEGEGRPLESLIRLEGPDLVVFGDAGQGWLVGSGPGRLPAGKLPTLASWLADLGMGVDWGGFGVYAAKAVTVGEPMRFVLRLNHRF